MDGLCRRSDGNGAAAVRSMVELLEAEAALAAQRSLIWLLFAIDSFSNNIGVLNEGSDVRHMILEGIKPQTMPDNKDAGESDEDEDDEYGNDQENDGGEDSGEEGNGEGDEDDEDPGANGEGGSEESEDDEEEEEEDEDGEDDGDEDEDGEEEDDEEEPPSKRKK